MAVSSMLLSIPKRDQYAPYRFALFGTATVGKSALICRYLFDTYREDYIPTYEDHFQSMAIIDNIESEFEIVDTPGSDQAFTNLIIEKKDSMYNDLDAYVLVYDITNVESFKALDPLYAFLIGQ